MNKWLIGVFTGFTLLTAVPSSMYAGGGPVALYAFPQRPFDQTKTFILNAEIYSSGSCSELQPTFAFKDSKESDTITPFTPPDDGTYITRHYYTGQPNFQWKEICDFYVQAKSATAEQRTVTVTVSVDGKTQERETKVAYGDDYYSKQLQNYGRVNDADNTPHIDVISEKYLGGPKREVVVHWQKIPWAQKYAVFSSMLDEKGNKITPYLPYPPTTETKTTLNIAAFSPFYLSVKACKEDDPCDTLGENPYARRLIDKMRNVDESKLPVTPFVTNIPTKTIQKQLDITPFPTTETQGRVEELHKKIAELEGKLEESQKKQSALEKTVNDLLILIKNLFAVFNR